MVSAEIIDFSLTEIGSNAEVFQLGRQSAKSSIRILHQGDSCAQAFIKIGARLSVVYSTSLGSGGCVVGRSRVVCSTCARSSILLGSRSSRGSIWHTKVKAQATNVDIAMAPEEKSAKDGLAEDVENTVEDSFGVRRDDIPAFTHAPGDGVQAPETDSPKTAESVDSVDIGTEITSKATSIEDDGPGDEE